MFMQTKPYRWLLLPWLLLLQACTTTGSSEPYRLEWIIAPGQKLTYKTIVSRISPNDPDTVYPLSLTAEHVPNLGFDVFESAQNYNQFFKKLSLQLSKFDDLKTTDYVKKETVLERWNNQFFATLHKWHIESPEDEKKLGKPFSTLYTVFDKSGAIYGNHLERNHRNYNSLIYDLPAIKPVIGAVWTPAVQLLGVNEGFVPTRSQKKGESRIVKIWQDDQRQRIMRTHTLIAEEIIGHRKAELNLVDHYQARGTLLMIKDFYMDRGQLKQLIGHTYIHFQGSLSGKAFQSKRVALKLVE